MNDEAQRPNTSLRTEAPSAPNRVVPQAAYPEWTREESEDWLRNFGVARMGVLAFITVGSALSTNPPGAYYLLGLYSFAFVTNHVYLYSLHRQQLVGVSQTWAQMFVDFAVVALTIAFTDGPASFFSFVFVVVVLEVGVLLGLRQGFVFATLASVFMFQQSLVYPIDDWMQFNEFSIWYNYAVQVMLLYLTAFISGYWNSRLNRLREFQREILDNLNAGFLITDTAGLVRMYNNSATAILGQTGRNLLGSPITEIMPIAKDIESPVLTALRSGQDYSSYEFLMRHPSGHDALIGITTNHVYNNDGHTTGLIISFSDLTEMDAMRNELRKQDRMAVVGELAAGLAHEIRNPVAVIRGAIDELSSSGDSPELRARLEAMALRESDHLNDIVQGFLNFSRDPSPTLESIHVRDVLSEVIELMERETADKPGLEIKSSLTTDTDLIQADASQLKQVFVNICHNAIEAMGEEGTLVIQTTQTEEGPVEIRFEDTGPGIEPERVDKIFEPFFTMKASGVGMGLAVCMRIITAHNGTIRATNRSGGGCAMIVQLPIVRGAAEGIHHAS